MPRIFTSYALTGSYVAPVDLTLTEARVQVHNASGSRGTPFLFIITSDVDFVTEENAIQLISYFDEGDFISRNVFSNLEIPLLKSTPLYWTSGGTSGVIQLIFREISAQTLS